MTFSRMTEIFQCSCVPLAGSISWPDVVTSSDIPVLNIISVLVSKKFKLSHFSISFYTVSEIFSVLVSIKFFKK